MPSMQTPERGKSYSRYRKQSGHRFSYRIHFPVGASGKEPVCDLRDIGLIPGWERFPGGEHDNPLLHSCLENPMNRGAWWATVHKVTEAGRTEHMCMQRYLISKVLLKIIFFVLESQSFKICFSCFKNELIKTILQKHTKKKKF